MLGYLRSQRAVVNIYVKTLSPHRLKLLPMLPAFTVNLPKQGLGSGFFVHSSGYVNTAGVTMAQGLAFAVPSTHVREFLDGVLKRTTDSPRSSSAPAAVRSGLVDHGHPLAQ